MNQTERIINGSEHFLESITKNGSEFFLESITGSEDVISPETKPNNKAFVAVFVFLGLLICGGNGLFIISYYASKMRTFRKMANYMYFYIHLAFADLLVGLSIPYHIVLFLKPDLLHQTAICLARYATITFPMAASVLSLLIITVDRYIAFAKPLNYTVIMTRKRSHFIMFGAWIFSFLFGVVGPIISAKDRQHIKQTEKNPECDFPTTIKQEYLSYVVIPCMAVTTIAISILYVRILLIVHSQNTRRRRLSSPSVLENHSNSKLPRIKQEVQVAKIGILVLGTFYSCWLPFYVILSIQVYSGRLDDPHLNKCRTIATFPAVANSAVNCFIYAIRMPQFRRMVKELFCYKSTRDKLRSRAFSDSKGSTMRNIDHSGGSPARELEHSGSYVKESSGSC